VADSFEGLPSQPDKFPLNQKLMKPIHDEGLQYLHGIDESKKMSKPMIADTSSIS